ncbi:TetR/AcrR family transcriptional regulator [Nocardia sp. NBC_00565]|uniref:TetR/AcrR family transcriptional regulator n=1 Tax=Nocardia sp. NBC_00565 TaxID=2975993 RepID=UPI002E80CB85|nr:TetR/AcrR family transcriptional regulator [Nocardia sp. NBC_00565]WUC06085.1 TetR/AcrR family transcriptional regulator [Nocardia sp. NBC_00565]
MAVAYDQWVPKLWNETIETHRREVRAAIMDTTAALVFEHGLRAVTMSQIADETGIGRATLYKYFPDVDTILRAWHARQITGHLRQLAEIRDSADTPAKRLPAVLATYAHIAQQTRSHDTELVKFLHPDEQIAEAQQQLHGMIRQLIADGARDGELRDDVAPDELANYCLHALTAAATLTTEEAIDRLTAVTLAGLQPPGASSPSRR